MNEHKNVDHLSNGINLEYCLLILNSIFFGKIRNTDLVKKLYLISNLKLKCFIALH